MVDLYNLSSRYWGGDVVSLHASTIAGDVFATIPLTFVNTGKVNTWEYILHLANMLVDPVPHSTCEILTKEGERVELLDAPEAGDYIYRQSGMWSSNCDQLKGLNDVEMQVPMPPSLTPPDRSIRIEEEPRPPRALCHLRLPPALRSTTRCASDLVVAPANHSYYGTERLSHGSSSSGLQLYYHRRRGNGLPPCTYRTEESRRCEAITMCFTSFN